MNGTGNSIMEPRQPIARMAFAVPTSAATAATTTIGMKIKYIGPYASASVEVAASTGNITFKVGSGTGGILAADTSVVASTGIIDVGTYTTFGEIVDQINQSPNWSAYLVGVLRADASSNALYTLAETTLTKSSADLVLPTDCAVTLTTAVRMGCRDAVSGSEEKGAVELYRIISLVSGTTPTLRIYEIDEATKSETQVYASLGGATGAENTKDFVANGKGGFGVSKVGRHLLVKLITTSSHTANQLTVVGAIDKGM